MACILVERFFGKCGHTIYSEKHQERCKMAPDDIENWRPKPTATTWGPIVHWSPFPMRRRPEYHWDLCGAWDCFGRIQAEPLIQETRKIWRNKVETWEAENVFTLNALKTKEMAKRFVRNKNFEESWPPFQAAFREKYKDAKPADRVSLYLIDLTKPPKLMIKKFFAPLKDVPDEICIICSNKFADEPTETGDPLVGEGVASRVPGCPVGHILHNQCLARTWATEITPPLGEFEGQTCPECKTDIGVRFAVYNGVEKPTRRYLSVNEDGRHPFARVIIDGYLDNLTETMSHRRNSYMKLRPFQRPSDYDRWGNRLDLP